MHNLENRQKIKKKSKLLYDTVDTIAHDVRIRREINPTDNPTVGNRISFG